MELTLQLVRDHINKIEISISWRPSRNAEVHAPTALTCPQEGLKSAVQRRGLLYIVAQRVCLVARRGIPARP